MQLIRHRCVAWLFDRVRFRPPDAAGQRGGEGDQSSKKAQAPPDRPLCTTHQFMAAETAVAIERTGDAPAVSTLMQLQPAVSAARFLGVVEDHRRLVTSRA